MCKFFKMIIVQGLCVYVSYSVVVLLLIFRLFLNSIEVLFYVKLGGSWSKVVQCLSDIRISDICKNFECQCLNLVQLIRLYYIIFWEKNLLQED